MSKQQKIIDKIKARPLPSDIKWTELRGILEHFGYELSQGSGSRRKFFHREKGLLIILHQPHPGQIVAKCYIADVVEHLEEHGFLKREK